MYEKALYDRTSTHGNLEYIWMKRARVKQLLRAFYCSKEYLNNRYMYTRKSVFLLPIAYLHRGINAILKLMNGKIRLFELDTETGKKYNEITQRWSALLKDLGIL